MDGVTISKGRLQGRLQAPPSKSMAHRGMICGALSGGECRIRPMISSKDMQATRQCLAALGYASTLEGDVLAFHGRKAIQGQPVLDCIESGSTLRFMLPIAQAVCRGGVFLGQGRLGSRPLTPYEEIWQRQGEPYAYAQGLPQGRLRLTVDGALAPGEFVLPGNVSSQFVTGLLLALPMLAGDSVIRILPPLESEGYVELTLAAQAYFGVEVRRPDPFTFLIRGGQRYQPKDMVIEGDYSQAAVFLCAGALGHQVQVAGLRLDSRQGDRQILRWLEQMGAKVLPEKEGIRVQGAGLHGIRVDGSQCPDILPMLALSCCLAEGESRISHCGRLRIKECDRLAATVRLLGALGADIREDGEDMVIRGKKSLAGGVSLDCCNDHRMAMMLSIGALHCERPVTLLGAECVAKSWPGYFQELARLTRPAQ